MANGAKGETLPMPQSSRLVVFLVSSIQTKTEPWQYLPDSYVLRKVGIEFVKISLGHISLTKSVFLAHEALRRTVADCSARYPEKRQAIIAWGVGGLLVKSFLVATRAQDFSRQLRLVVLIGTPGRRSPLQRFILRLLPSTFFRALHGTMGALAFDTDELASAWDHFTLKSGVRTVYVVGSNDLVAPYSAADQWDSRNVFVIPEDHTSLIGGGALKDPNSSLGIILDRVLAEEAGSAGAIHKTG